MPLEGARGHRLEGVDARERVDLDGVEALERRAGADDGRAHLDARADAAADARAYPGEDPDSVKPPSVVADHIVQMLVDDFPNLCRERVETPR